MPILLEKKNVKCRKTHICQGCGKQIQIGEIARKSDIVDNDIWHCYECKSCYEYRENYCSFCNYFHDCIGENYEIGAIKECRTEGRNDV